MTTSLWDETTPHNYKFALRASAVLALASIALNFAVPDIGVFGASSGHIAAEVISAVLAIVIGITLIATSRSSNQPWLKILGYGFVIVAGLDLIHGIASSAATGNAFGDSSQVSAWTSLLSRTVLAGFALGAALKLEKGNGNGNSVQSLRLPIVLVVSLVVAPAIYTLLRDTGDGAFAIETRLSLLPGLAFLAAFLIVQRRDSPSMHTLSAFCVFLLVSGAADATFMFHTAGPFDGYFSALHIYKLFAYGVLIVGLLAELQRLHAFEAHARQLLGRVNKSLNESNLSLTTVGNDLQALNRIGRIAGISLSIPDHFDEISDVIRSRIEADRVAVAVVDPTGTSSRIVAISGLLLANRKIGDSVPLHDTHTGDAVLKRTTIIVNDSNIEQVLEEKPQLKGDLDAGIRSWITTPIIAEDEIVGVLLVRSLKPNVYSERETQFVEQVASQMAGLVRNVKERRFNIA